MTSTSGQSSTCPDQLIEPEQIIEEIYRAEWGRLLSLLVARTRRLDLAEDGLSEAFAKACERWPGRGMPANPSGWLFTTAYRYVVDHLRAEAVAGRKAPLLAVRAEWVPPEDLAVELADDRLHLILLCCHPALARESQSALALRLVLGTSTEQLARLFLVSRATMAARLTRAKRKIVRAGIPLGTPLGEELRNRLDEVCRTIYLAFTAGYTPMVGVELLRADLAGDAVRLAAVLHDLEPDATQVRSMLALLLLQHSRRDARQRHGRLVPLADQDRSTWHQDEIRTGLELIAEVEQQDGYAEELRLQALIAAEHASAATAPATDWAMIERYYADLDARTGSPIVRLGRAVAVAMVEGPQAGLAMLSTLEATLPAHHRVAAVRAELAQRAGELDLADASYERALTLCHNDAERAHLQEKLDALRTD
ncbi:MAG: RNA polymerase subunit sigma-24 [Microlunatus sp.]|nr:RNA polymerase subunit sigma-24 [Microlunatus sp.]MDN5803872.1 RNA polymerase subunit sigma-24 [Microlunatus sp.]